ncbi:hypothetical protein SAMN05216383_10762 [Prevotella sp. KH2C16]|nr:hypothetical protein SAMN05216383_10762 [Prevotella sp. KH2C16]
MNVFMLLIEIPHVSNAATKGRERQDYKRRVTRLQTACNRITSGL